jgi:hypothetical protein
MAGRLRRRPGAAELAADEGPFVSFTDLFIGILFLFLILVAALMLMHQEAVQEANAAVRAYDSEVQRMSGQIQSMQATLDAAARMDAEHPPFRLAMVYNMYQAPDRAQADWTYARTVEVFRAPHDICFINIIQRNNDLSFAWKGPMKAEDIPTAASERGAQLGAPCRLTAAGEQWNSGSETGSVERTSADLYSGATVLHKKDRDETLNLQYRILGIYDDYFRQSAAGGGR